MNRQRLVDLNLLDGVKHTIDPMAAHLIRSAGREAGFIQPNTPQPLISAALDGMEVHFVTGGKWSLYEFLEAALVITGPTRLYMSTYSITEFSARQLYMHLAEGRLTELHMLVDYRAKVRYPQVYQLAENVATRIRLTPVHAKVMVLIGEDYTLTLQGSANWTDNPRIEAGTITCNKEVAAFHKSWLEKSLEDGHPFD